ncbi:MAG TPA: hypothetical protein VH374_20130 [Polyangia bacterium]|jgi:hypothetical protein|nr:hypothetical protein [Polyangia bacterium]
MSPGYRKRRVFATVEMIVDIVAICLHRFIASPVRRIISAGGSAAGPVIDA